LPDIIFVILDDTSSVIQVLEFTSKKDPGHAYSAKYFHSNIAICKQAFYNNMYRKNLLLILIGIIRINKNLLLILIFIFAIIIYINYILY